MELKFNEGKYVRGACGGLETVSGKEELLQRALMRLSARRGGFFPMPDFGSELHTLFSMKKPQRAAAARRMVYEALSPETQLQVVSVDYRESGATAEISVELALAGGENARLNVAVAEWGTNEND